jgi:hypothetical protein
VATALLGGVLASRGQALLGDFRQAALVGAGVTVLAAVCAGLLLRNGRLDPKP